MEIFKLVGSVFVDTDKANKSLSKTGKDVDGLGKKFMNGIKTVAKWGTAVGAAAIAGGAAIWKMAGQSAEAADRIDKMSQRLGMSRQAFQEWVTYTAPYVQKCA